MLKLGKEVTQAESLLSPASGGEEVAKNHGKVRCWGMLQYRDEYE